MTKIRSYRLLIGYAYLIEFFITMVIYGVSMHYHLGEAIVAVIRRYWQAIATISGLLFGASVAFSIYFAHLQNTEFGRYLRFKKADSHYLSGFRFQSLLFFVMIVLSAFSGIIESLVWAHMLFVITTYTLINGVTIVQNTYWIAKLNGQYNRIREKMPDE